MLINQKILFPQITQNLAARINLVKVHVLKRLAKMDK